MTNAEVYDAISKNLIDGAEAAETINKAMQSLYGGSMEKLSETYSGLLSTLEDSQNELDNAAGEGYLEERKKGLKEQIAWMQSSEMEEGYRLMGQYEAKLENDKEELLRKALDDVKNSEEYQKALAEGNGVEAGRLLAEAKSKAQMEYNSSQGVQDQVASEKKLIENVTEMLVQDETYYNAGYILGIERGKGIKAGELAYLRGDAAKISEGFFTDESEKFDFAAEQRAIAALENQYLTENNVTINVSGEGDADAVADRVSRKVLEAMATLQPR